MSKLSFDDTLRRFDLIVSNRSETDKKNNLMYRRICREVFKKLYSNFQFHNTINVGVNFAAAGIVSAINSKRKNKKYSFAKSFRKLNSKNYVITYSDLHKISCFLDKSEFVLVLKLLKIQYKYGLNEAISSISE
ncbi:MAG: hypothetical protein COA77_10490 [Thaumarchaeota archaeon]|nr:MAG: hypothetical protein COA77_10490 [Nitrososphaerota archaeon]